MCKTNQTTNEAVDIAAENERIKARLAGMELKVLRNNYGNECF